MEIQNLKEETYASGRVIFRQGEYASCMYEITEGKVGIFVNYQTDKEKKLTELTSGQCFGEMGILEFYPRSATAVSLAETTKVQVITLDTFQHYFELAPEKVFAIMQHMSQRIRNLTEDYMEVCRTLSENMEAEEKGKEKSGWLRSKLKKFAEIYNESAQEAAKYNNDIVTLGNFYHGRLYW